MTAAPSPSLRALTVDGARDLVLGAPDGFTRVIATDADGTLWEGDVGDTLFMQVARDRDFRGAGLDALRAAGAHYLTAPPDDPLALAEALMERYAAGHIAVEAMCVLQAVSVADRPLADMELLYARAADAVIDRVRPAVRALMDALSRDGFVVHVVTASLGSLVRVALARAGLSAARVSGGELDAIDGWARPTLAVQIPVFHRKVEALTAAGDWPPALGMGDGGWDAPFLAGSHLPLLIHPKASLVEALSTHPRVTKLELALV